MKIQLMEHQNCYFILGYNRQMLFCHRHHMSAITHSCLAILICLFWLSAVGFQFLCEPLPALLRFLVQIVSSFQLLYNDLRTIQINLIPRGDKLTPPIDNAENSKIRRPKACLPLSFSFYLFHVFPEDFGSIRPLDQKLWHLS